ncbi:unnamed protein product [Didymodactylos carnosus]|uniref:Uncharacterized protein n=1 Tax=Didymodactylos carnosus TaxID=1234261 RepID=A0A815ZCF6_9BILA|nr:unnamed protein product [Didymodactylos carnosus]CAF4450825.1 unnamed protein product [Didymodactylos carnosus]
MTGIPTGTGAGPVPESQDLPRNLRGSIAYDLCSLKASRRKETAVEVVPEKSALSGNKLRWSTLRTSPASGNMSFVLKSSDFSQNQKLTSDSRSVLKAESN